MTFKGFFGLLGFRNISPYFSLLMDCPSSTFHYPHTLRQQGIILLLAHFLYIFMPEGCSSPCVFKKKNLSTIALQCCVSFRSITKCISYMFYIYLPSLLDLPPPHPIPLL